MTTINARRTYASVVAKKANVSMREESSVGGRRNAGDLLFESTSKNAYVGFAKANRTTFDETGSFQVLVEVLKKQATLRLFT